MSKLPDVMFIIDPVEEATALAEARKLEFRLLQFVIQIVILI